MAAENVGVARPSGLVTIPAIPPGLLQAGENILAVEVHQSATNTDVRFATEMVIVETPRAAIQPPQLLFTEIAAGDSNALFVEVRNVDEHAIELQTITLRSVGTIDLDVTLPAGNLSPGQVAVLTPDDLGFTPVSYTHLTLPTICSV